jgi:hypothetical protein
MSLERWASSLDISSTALELEQFREHRVDERLGDDVAVLRENAGDVLEPLAESDEARHEDLATGHVVLVEGAEIVEVAAARGDQSRLMVEPTEEV